MKKLLVEQVALIGFLGLVCFAEHAMMQAGSKDMMSLVIIASIALFVLTVVTLHFILPAFRELRKLDATYYCGTLDLLFVLVVLCYAVKYQYVVAAHLAIGG